jgi:hypothetical protein
MIRRIFPELIFNKIGATQAMEGPVGQVFYMGNSRVANTTVQTMYSMFRVTPFGQVANKIGSASGVNAFNPATGASALTGGVAAGGFNTSSVIQASAGSPSTTMGGYIAGWPNPATILGWSVSAGERLRTTAIPEVTLHIQKQTVQARTRKMRALWTLEAAQDLKAYHNLDLESELTELLSKEIQLEIDRELIEDIRMIAYGIDAQMGNPFGAWYLRSLFNGNADNFPEIGGIGPDGNTFTPGAFTYEYPSTVAGEAGGGTNLAGLPTVQGSNVYVMDLSQFISTATSYAPQHLGQVYSNVLALINFASQDIYRTTFRAPGTVLITSPLIASMLESAAKLEGGMPMEGKPTNQENNSVKYVGKFMGKYDMIVDPMFPEDEIIVGYKGSSNLDAGLVYCPYVPLMPLQTITDPENFQPRKGVLTRYGKLAIQPASRFFRVIRLIGTGSDFITKQIFRNTGAGSTSLTGGTFY